MAWLAVERSTNAKRAPAQRLPLYTEILTLPLTSIASRAPLVEQAATIVDQDFAGDWWPILNWAPPP